MKKNDGPRELIRQAVVSRNFEPVEQLLKQCNIFIRNDKGEIREWVDIVENIANSWDLIPKK